MARKQFDDLGELQTAVMEVVWALGEATVHQVRDRLGRSAPPAYTTVLSVMQKLEKAGWLRHRRRGRTYVYVAARTRAEEGARCLRSFTKRVFGGDSLRLIEHLLESERLSDAELAELRKLIDRHREVNRHD